MVVLLIFYNPTKNNFYFRITDSLFFRKVGDINGYDHILIQILVYDNENFMSVKDDIDYYYKKHYADFNNNNNYSSLINRLFRFIK